MQVEVDSEIHANQFWWAWSSSSFRDYGSFLTKLSPSKAAKISIQTMGYSPWGSKNLIEQNWLRKFMQVEVDVKCMQTNFGGQWHLFGFGKPWLLFQRPSKTAKISLQTMEL